jgi:hypothetical protein
MSNCRGQKELITHGFGPQGAVKDTNDILDDYILLLNSYAEVQEIKEVFIAAVEISDNI